LHTNFFYFWNSFLRLEWENSSTKNENSVQYDESKIAEVAINGPQQNNSFDCGVYVLEYAEVFLDNYLQCRQSKRTPVTKEKVESKLENFVSPESFDDNTIVEKRENIKENIATDASRYTRYILEAASSKAK